MTQQITLIPIDQLDPHPHNPRGAVDPESVQELAASIKEKGILEPLIVVPVRSSGQQWKIERYTVVAGHRRLIAGRLAGREEVPAIVRELTPIEQEEIMLVENLQRQDLTLLQEARAFKRLLDQGMIQSEAARKLGLAQGRIQQRLCILKLPESVQKMYDLNELPITAAPLLIKIESIDRQERLAQMIAARRLTVPKLEEMVAKAIEAEQVTAQVDRSRNGNRNGNSNREVRKPVDLFTREHAVRALEDLNGTTLTYNDLLKAFDGICERCGMKQHPEICTACPLPQLIHSLVKQNA
jgi:ParB family chromosome partitioning protein